MPASTKRYLQVKRALDVILSAIMLVVLAPVFLIIALLSLVFLGRPIIFSQQRPGLLGKPFKLYKFRTMKVHSSQGDTHLGDAAAVSTDEERLTKYGAFLRRSSLDELPELFNIFKGNMSFVGPRPLLMEYLPLYSPQQARRHEVRPGLTGLAQVNGRNALDWSTRFKYDVEYIDSISLSADCRILFQTFAVVFSGRGVSSNSSVTMEPFNGHN